MDLTASLEAPKFENDWLQSLLKQLTPFSTWSVCHGSSSNCFNWKEFSFHFFLEKTSQSQLWKQIFSIKLFLKTRNSPGEVTGRAKLDFAEELTVVYILMWRNPASLQVYF